MNLKLKGILSIIGIWLKINKLTNKGKSYKKQQQHILNKEAKHFIPTVKKTQNGYSLKLKYSLEPWLNQSGCIIKFWIIITLALDWSQRQQNARTRILQYLKSKTAMSMILKIINVMKEKKVVLTHQYEATRNRSTSHRHSQWSWILMKLAFVCLF